jgi:hypothetical protein
MLTTALDDAQFAIGELDDMLRHEAGRIRGAKDPRQREILLDRADQLLDARLKAMLERDVYEGDSDGLS